MSAWVGLDLSQNITPPRAPCGAKKIVNRHQKSNSYIASLQGRVYVCSHSRPNIYLRLHLSSWYENTARSTQEIERKHRKPVSCFTAIFQLAPNIHFSAKLSQNPFVANGSGGLLIELSALVFSFQLNHSTHSESDCREHPPP